MKEFLKTLMIGNKFKLRVEKLGKDSVDIDIQTEHRYFNLPNLSIEEIEQILEFLIECLEELDND